MPSVSVTEQFFSKTTHSCPDNLMVAACFLAIMTSLAEKIPKNMTQFTLFFHFNQR
jgi:hypothetical protein